MDGGIDSLGRVFRYRFNMTEKQLEELKEGRAAGKNWDELALTFGCSRPVIIRMAERHGFYAKSLRGKHMQDRAKVDPICSERREAGNEPLKAGHVISISCLERAVTFNPE